MASGINIVKGYLPRFRESDHGTLGIMMVPAANGSLFTCRTIELPWKENRQNVSCIPDGSYHCVPYRSRTFGDVYLVQDVKGRSWILTHQGNWAGDVSKGLRSNSNGCIILGDKHALIYGQMAVTLSMVTLRRFLEAMAGREFILCVNSYHRGGI